MRLLIDSRSGRAPRSVALLLGVSLITACAQEATSNPPPSGSGGSTTTGTGGMGSGGSQSVGSGGFGASGGSVGTGGGPGTGGIVGTGGSGTGSGGIATGGFAGGGSGGSSSGSGGAMSGTGGGASGGGGGSPHGGASGGGGAAGAGGMASWALAGPSLCTGSPFAICEDFESTAPGATPANWTFPGSNYGTGVIAVAADMAARGSHSLKVTVAAGSGSTERYLQRTNLGPLANAHYGRLFFRVQNPTTTEFVHWDLILGQGQFNGANRRIRWGSTGTATATASGSWHWIYNIEQGDTGFEDGNTHPVLDQWMCVEWSWQSAGQVIRFYFNGIEDQTFHRDGTLPNGSSPQIPVFASLNFGLAKYQATNGPMVFWIDEIAIDAQRIGCAN
jgi:hypothetical protein